MRNLRTVLFLALVVLIASPVLANPVPPWITNMTKGMNLTEAQKTELETVKKELAPKAPPIYRMLSENLKQLEAARNAWASGNVWATLAKEGQEQLEAAKMKAAALQQEVRVKVMFVLTDEQKGQLKKLEKEQLIKQKVEQLKKLKEQLKMQEEQLKELKASR